MKLHHLFKILNVNVSNSPSLAMCMSCVKITKHFIVMCTAIYISHGITLSRLHVERSQP